MKIPPQLYSPYAWTEHRLEGGDWSRRQRIRSVGVGSNNPGSWSVVFGAVAVLRDSVYFRLWNWHAKFRGQKVKVATFVR
ncbi:MAG: hypothetical protein P8M25_04720, partial [Paracoccaceae bacterium]|nr:hypothetical protein [Paracoccaceae bacterium]